MHPILMCRSRGFQRVAGQLESLIKRIEDDNGEMTVFRDDSVSEYRKFRNYFEEILYKELFSPKKEVRQMSEDYAYLYFIYGNLLFELERYDDARTALMKALRVNPISADVIFELAEINKLRGEWDDYLAYVKQCFSVAYNAVHVGRCYRNLGYYYIEQKEYELAAAIYFKSMQYDKNSTLPQSQLFYIQQVSGKPIPELSYDDVQGLLKKNEIPTDASNTILGIAYSIGKSAAEQGNNDAARYFFSILYDLTHDDEVKEMIDKLVP